MSEDKDILLQIRQGDERAFELLFRRYYPRLRCFATRYVGEQSAHDIIQESFLKLWSRRIFLYDQSAGALLFSMVRNACLDYLKHKIVVSKHECIMAADGDERLYYADFNADSKLIYEELREDVEAAINSLSDRCREVFMMSRFEGLKNREIAEQLGISTTAVEKHISKALAALSMRVSRHYKLNHS